jgi:hypothetical protein
MGMNLRFRGGEDCTINACLGLCEGGIATKATRSHRTRRQAHMIFVFMMGAPERFAVISVGVIQSAVMPGGFTS